MHIFALFFYSLSFHVFLDLMTMRHKSRANDLFGGATHFSGSQLPTYEEVGKDWKACKLDLQTEKPKERILNRDVAKRVMQKMKKGE